ALVAQTETEVDPHIAAIDEGRATSLPFRVIRGQTAHEHANAPHPFALLGARHYRPRRRAKSCDELPPPHPWPPVFVDQPIALLVVLELVSRRGRRWLLPAGRPRPSRWLLVAYVPRWCVFLPGGLLCEAEGCPVSPWAAN